MSFNGLPCKFDLDLRANYSSPLLIRIYQPATNITMLVVSTKQLFIFSRNSEVCPLNNGIMDIFVLKEMKTKCFYECVPEVRLDVVSFFLSPYLHTVSVESRLTHAGVRKCSDRLLLTERVFIQ